MKLTSVTLIFAHYYTMPFPIHQQRCAPNKKPVICLAKFPEENIMYISLFHIIVPSLPHAHTISHQPIIMYSFFFDVLLVHLVLGGVCQDHMYSKCVLHFHSKLCCSNLWLTMLSFQVNMHQECPYGPPCQ